jgi:hypothetical protein
MGRDHRRLVVRYRTLELCFNHCVQGSDGWHQSVDQLTITFGHGPHHDVVNEHAAWCVPKSQLPIRQWLVANDLDEVGRKGTTSGDTPCGVTGLDGQSRKTDKTEALIHVNHQWQ